MILSEREHATQQRRAVIASVIGTTIEWYDFFLYSLASGLVFARLFFPHDDPLSGTLNAFAIYAVGFLARPIGAALFGHWGDRIGRKSTLIVTLLTMGIATMLVAAVPTYESIGIWGAVLLSVLRFVQGIGVGGEWGGSVLMSMEWAASNRNRGFLAIPGEQIEAGLSIEYGVRHRLEGEQADRLLMQFFNARCAVLAGGGEDLDHRAPDSVIAMQTA